MNLIPSRCIFTHLILLFMIPQFCFSQNCGFGGPFQSQLLQNPNLLNEISQSNQSLSSFNPPDEYIIPVVVHIIHSNGPENISDEQVYSAIEILNQGFKGDFDPDHLDTKIRFRLAEVDPKGCSSTGINRVPMETNPCILSSYDVPVPGVPASSIIYWPKTRYLNIWVVSCLDVQGVAAFAYYPSVGEPSEGIVILHQFFGDIGTATSNGTMGTHTIVHETGHVFGLIHTWGPDFGPPSPTWFNCHTNAEGETNGDFVSDTPPQTIWYGGVGCNSGINSCHLDDPDLLDDDDNFMSGNNLCLKAFTPGQNSKFIQARLLDTYNSLWSPVGQECAGFESFFPTEIEINQNTNWTTSNLPNNGNIIMDKIVVKSGSTLTIGPGVEIHFRRCNQLNNFIIEPEAKVLLQGTLTSSSCDPSDYWYGVEVAGVSVFPGQILTPGEIIADYGAKIENAEFGIRNRAVVNGVEYKGGRIKCYGTTFRNNRTGVRFYHYINIDKPAPGPISWMIPEDDAEFIECTFVINGTGVSKKLGGNLLHHIYIEGVKGIVIDKSVFQNYTGNGGFKGQGIGVYAVDGGFDISGDGDYSSVEFLNLLFGVQTINTGNGQPFSIRECAFSGNNVGVFDKGVSNATIIFNYFIYVHSGVLIADQIGVYLEGLMSFVDIQENLFYDVNSNFSVPLNTVGICSNGTGQFDNTIRRNTFESISVGNVANGSNSGPSSGLRYTCNTNRYLLGYDIALVDGASIRSIQEGPLQAGLTSSAGNKFSYFNDNYDEDDIISSGVPFTYRYRTPFNTYENPLETTAGKVAKLTTTIANPCLPEHNLEQPPLLSEWKIKFESEKMEWQAAKQSFFSSLDGGNTTLLVDMIENGQNSPGVLSSLVAFAPWVSEKAVNALISKHPIFSSNAIRNIVLQNPDLLLNPDFCIYLANCGVFGLADLQAFESIKGTTTVRTAIQQNMAIHKAEMSYWGSLYLNMCVKDRSKFNTNDYQTFLHNFDDYNAEVLIIQELLSRGDFTQVVSKLDELESGYCETSSELLEHSQYRQIIEILMNAFLDSRTAYELNQSEMTQIENIKNNSSGLPNLLSTNLLQGINNTIPSFAPCKLPTQLTQSNKTNSDRAIINESNNINSKLDEVVCYPNPAKNFVQFDFGAISEISKSGELVIFDLMGNTINKKALDSSISYAVIDLRDIPNGIYFYKVVFGQGGTYSGCFIVNKN